MLNLYVSLANNDQMSEGVEVVREHSLCESNFQYITLERTQWEWNNLLMGREVKKENLKKKKFSNNNNFKKLLRNQYLSILKFTSSPPNRYHIHHGQSLACTCDLLDSFCWNRPCTHHSEIIRLYFAYKKTWHNKTDALL